jgi:crotonobetainyl-CoA:carnitine CoA-transferase CaiB-like acyl-CoA transferase
MYAGVAILAAVAHLNRPGLGSIDLALYDVMVAMLANARRTPDKRACTRTRKHASEHRAYQVLHRWTPDHRRQQRRSSSVSARSPARSWRAIRASYNADRVRHRAILVPLPKRCANAPW